MPGGKQPELQHSNAWCSALLIINCFVFISHMHHRLPYQQAKKKHHISQLVIVSWASCSAGRTRSCCWLAVQAMPIGPDVLISTLQTPALPHCCKHLPSLAVAAALGTARVSGLDADGIEDRAYRLYYNEGQNRTDAFARVGGCVRFEAVVPPHHDSCRAPLLPL